MRVHVAAILLVGLAAGALADEPTLPRTMMDFYRLASGAERQGETGAARDHYRAGLAAVPQSPHLWLGVVRTSAALQDEAACLEALRRLAALGAAFDPAGDAAVASLLGKPEFAAAAAAIARNAAPPPPAPVVATFADPDLWNEGIACDLDTGDLYAGSVKLSKLLRIRDGVESLLGTSANDGLLEILGLDVDEQRRHLWAVTGRDSTEAGAPHDFGEAPRANALVQYDLESGAQLAVYPMVFDGRTHMWNDVSVSPDGTAYFTDLAASEVYRLPPGGKPEVILDGTDFQYFNGIVVDDTGTLLYVAALEGVVVIDLADLSAALLDCPPDVYAGLGDGMAIGGGDLFIVQNNGLLNQRILRVRLDETGRRALGAETVPCGLPDGLMPYTCALGNGVLYVNGTPPFAEYDGEDFARPSVIVALKID
ncbi:MAG: SMP-30/gluconolactonase/LRE family protein [Candidatus Krumholzibacteriia bacterium]